MASRENIKKHPFFLDAKKNSTVPPWFMECTRDEAASFLIKHSRDGNVIMRPSSDGQYALTVRTSSSRTGITKVSHHSIKRNEQNQFYVDIDVQHQPARTLSEILERFMYLAGNRYRAFASRPTDSGCLPEVKNSDDSNLLSAVNVGLRQPNLQQQFNDYADMQRTRQSSSADSSSTSSDQHYLCMTGRNNNPGSTSTGEYLTMLDQDDDDDEDNKFADYLTVSTEPGKPEPPPRPDVSSNANTQR